MRLEEYNPKFRIENGDYEEVSFEGACEMLNTGHMVWFAKHSLDLGNLTKYTKDFDLEIMEEGQQPVHILLNREEYTVEQVISECIRLLKEHYKISCLEQK